MTLPPGATLANYRVIERIGVGGMGEVYQARDLKLARDVALKLLPGGFVEDPQASNRLTQEARLLASLNHPSIATLYGFDAEGETQFLVMELVEGETLEDTLRRGPIPLEDVYEVFLQVAEGIEAAHAKNVVHRDLKPANIKVLPRKRVKILDFGLAKALALEAGIESAGTSLPPQGPLSRSRSPEQRDPVGTFPFAALSPGTLPPSITATGEVMGTPGYMSPEQAFGDPVGKPTDIWAFGCCLFEAITGRKAFAGETLPEMVRAILIGQPDWTQLDQVPGGVRDLVYLCLAKEPRDRVQSASDIVARLQALRLQATASESLDAPSAPASLEQRLFDLSQDMLCVASVDGFLKRVNPSFERTLGWSAQELYSRPFMDFVHEDDWEATGEEMKKLAEGIPTHSFSNRYRCRDGTYRRLYWTAKLEETTGLLYAVARFMPPASNG